MNSESWQYDLQYAAIGVLAAAAIEFFAPRHRLAPLLMAGVVAAAYAHMVPEPKWGARSGATFAQLPLVAGVAGMGSDSRVRAGAWGGLTGILLRAIAA